MLGKGTMPELLVTVDADYNPNYFDFRVVNGLWDGIFNRGYITILGCPGGDFSSLDKTEILCSNQDRLRCSDWNGEYQIVFNNFDNPDYVAPEPKKFVVPADWDDDIAF